MGGWGACAHPSAGMSGMGADGTPGTSRDRSWPCVSAPKSLSSSLGRGAQSQLSSFISLVVNCTGRKKETRGTVPELVECK